MKTMIFSHPEHGQIYDIIISHLGNPMLEKIRNHDEYALYMVEIQSMLLNEKRYVIAMVHNDVRSIGSKDYLSNLKWKSLQTRTLDDAQPLHIPPYAYLVQRGLSANVPLQLQSRTKEISIYHAHKYPIEVSLLHTKNTEYEYPNEGNLASALETFQTIIQFR